MGKISHVIANAGIHRPDDIFSYSGDHQEPKEPDLSVIDVNIRGTLYTAKLAMIQLGNYSLNMWR
ncbi:hypothetical protein N7471_001013 [Penicillium samsonianum]|uniref:uncharacterized protein n=1 Tax=Penicillium samsonianum TaxID=1882272 RepID=UPI0025490FCE|nr:uncharacterized protein N7471_001013 [Penicillium samsonianum]KAJ6149814.1 hypothetical protein N7471_001013 [Penicillium samsonianum]